MSRAAPADEFEIVFGSAGIEAINGAPLAELFEEGKDLSVDLKYVELPEMMALEP